jgi:hypothetical protein
MNQSQFAARHGVTRTTASKWRRRGLIKFNDDGDIDVRASDAALKKYRRTRSDFKSGSPQADSTDGDDSGMSYDEARRKKEVALATIRQIQAAQAAGELIPLREAETVFFECFRATRNAWLSWPIKTAPLVAADLGLSDIDRLAAVLAEHVHKQLAELGEPQADFSESGKH